MCKALVAHTPLIGTVPNDYEQVPYRKSIWKVEMM